MAAKPYLELSRKHIPKEFGRGHRIAGVVALIAVAIIGTTQWKHWPSSAATAEPAQQAIANGDSLPAVEYFPSKYQNQATQSEKHIEAF